MEFALIPILLVYPVSACFGGHGCCQSQQSGCGFFCGGGRGGYSVPFGGGSYAARAPSGPSFYNVPSAPGGGFYAAPAPPSSYAVGPAPAPPSSYPVGPAPAPPSSYGVGPAPAPPSYGVGPAPAPPSYGIGPAPAPPSYGAGPAPAPPSYGAGPAPAPPSYGGGPAPAPPYGAAPAPGPVPSFNPPQGGSSPGFYGGSSAYSRQQGAPSLSSFTEAQSQFRDPSLGDAQVPLLPPENPPVPGRFAEAVEQATLPDGGAIDLAGISSASSSIGEPIEGATHEVVQQQTPTASTIQAVPVITKNNKLRHWRY